MSSAGRGAQRIEADHYPTPSWCVDRITERLSLPGGVWLEPCAGNGNIIRAVNRRRAEDRPTWIAMDLREECLVPLQGMARNVLIRDFLGATGRTLPHVDVVFTNPPYCLAFEFIGRCLPLADHVVMLLRINFLASVVRHGLMSTNTPDVYVLPNRPSFTTGGTDSTEYAWFHWHGQRSHGRLEVLGLTSSTRRSTSDAQVDMFDG